MDRREKYQKMIEGVKDKSQKFAIIYYETYDGMMAAEMAGYSRSMVASWQTIMNSKRTMEYLEGMGKAKKMEILREEINARFTVVMRNQIEIRNRLIEMDTERSLEKASDINKDMLDRIGLKMEFKQEIYVRHEHIESEKKDIWTELRDDEEGRIDRAEKMKELRIKN